MTVLPGCPTGRVFENDSKGLAQFLKPYQDALAAKRLQAASIAAERERTTSLQEQQVRAEDKKDLQNERKKDEKDSKLSDHKKEEKDSKLSDHKKEEKDSKQADEKKEEEKGIKAKEKKNSEKKSSSKSKPILLHVIQGHFALVLSPCFVIDVHNDDCRIGGKTSKREIAKTSSFSDMQMLLKVASTSASLSYVDESGEAIAIENDEGHRYVI